MGSCCVYKKEITINNIISQNKPGQTSKLHINDKDKDKKQSKNIPNRNIFNNSSKLSQQPGKNSLSSNELSLNSIESSTLILNKIKNISKYKRNKEKDKEKETLNANRLTFFSIPRNERLSIKAYNLSNPVKIEGTNYPKGYVINLISMKSWLLVLDFMDKADLARLSYSTSFFNSLAKSPFLIKKFFNLSSSYQYTQTTTKASDFKYIHDYLNDNSNSKFHSILMDNINQDINNKSNDFIQKRDLEIIESQYESASNTPKISNKPDTLCCNLSKNKICKENDKYSGSISDLNTNNQVMSQLNSNDYLVNIQREHSVSVINPIQEKNALSSLSPINIRTPLKKEEDYNSFSKTASFEFLNLYKNNRKSDDHECRIITNNWLTGTHNGNACIKVKAFSLTKPFISAFELP